MEFWGVEVKPKKSYRLSRADYGGSRLHVTQATLGKKPSKDRTIVKCVAGDGPVVYICSLLPGVVETCSLDLYFEDDIVFSVKGSTSVHLVGYFEGSYEDDEPGEDVEYDGYSDEEDQSFDDDDDSMDEFIVDDDEDSEDDSDYQVIDEDDTVLVPNSGVIIEEVTDEGDSDVPQKNKNLSIVPVNAENGKKEIEPNGENSQKTADATNPASSEDEDGFPLSRKRKQETADPQSNKKRLPEKETSSEPAIAVDSATEAPGETAAVSESAKKKKKKKNKKKASEQQDEIDTKATPKDDGDTVTKEEDHNSGKKGTIRKYPNGLEIENVSMGTPDGNQATPGKKVGVVYTGKLKSNGKIFDTNVGRKPFFFRLGVGEVIKGWDIGVNGMRIGDKRRLTVPPSMGYGSKSVGKIPSNSWLVFDVELKEVK